MLFSGRIICNAWPRCLRVSVRRGTYIEGNFGLQMVASETTAVHSLMPHSYISVWHQFQSLTWETTLSCLTTHQHMHHYWLGKLSLKASWFDCPLWAKVLLFLLFLNIMLEIQWFESCLSCGVSSKLSPNSQRVDWWPYEIL